MPKETFFSEKYSGNSIAVREKLEELVSPGGVLSFVGTNRLRLLERAVYAAANGYYSKNLSAWELVGRFASRLTMTQANLEASISLDIEDDDSAGMTVH